MIPELLREIVAKGESLNVEFKGEEKSALSDSALVEAVICLANRSGVEPGWLLVGVEDDGRITGSRPRHSGEKTDTYRVSALIANRTRPSLACRAEIVEIDGLFVLVVEVPTSRTPVSTPEGKYQRRAIGGK
ncbi:MAG: ATP-binding protein, partial [Methanosarcinales archaeon]|nr:ATP-binding protein [Methanosarcinales archaeon]